MTRKSWTLIAIGASFVLLCIACILLRREYYVHRGGYLIASMRLEYPASGLVASGDGNVLAISEDGWLERLPRDVNYNRVLIYSLKSYRVTLEAPAFNRDDVGRVHGLSADGRWLTTISRV